MIAVVAAVRGQVERHAQSHLTCSEVAAVEGVARLGGAETRVLPDCPRTDGVHAAVWAAQVGRDASGVMQVLHPFQIHAGIEGLEGELFSVGEPSCWLLAAGC